MSKIQIWKVHNEIVVNSQDFSILEHLMERFTFKSTVSETITIPKNSDNLTDISDIESLMNPVKFKTKQTYRQQVYYAGMPDHRNRFTVAFGYINDVAKALKQMGHTPVLIDKAPPKDPSIFKPDWSRLRDSNVKLRDGQLDFLKKFFSKKHGRFDVTVGFGKSFLIAVIATLLPKARIDVITKSKQVLLQAIYPSLCAAVGGVGVCTSGKKDFGYRVMCYTTGSLHHGKSDADIVIADEHHELASDTHSLAIANKYYKARRYGLSATNDMRADNKDFRNQGLFGPVVYSYTYQQGVKAGFLTPMQVNWRSVAMDYDPSEGTSHPVYKKKKAIWQNEYRNEIIAQDARKYSAEDQILICVETLEHALFLKRHLPEFHLAYSPKPIDRKKLNEFSDLGILPDNFRPLNVERFRKLTTAFEKRICRRIIATPVYNVGVNFRDLNVLFRVDGGASDINSVQIPGRASRLGLSTYKNVAFVHDYLDEFNAAYRTKAISRGKVYVSLGWKQVNLDGFKLPVPLREKLSRSNYQQYLDYERGV